MPKTEQKARKTSDAVRILDGMIGEDSHLQQLASEEMVSAEVAQLICDVRLRRSEPTVKILGQACEVALGIDQRSEDIDIMIPLHWESSFF